MEAGADYTDDVALPVLLVAGADYTDDLALPVLLVAGSYFWVGGGVFFSCYWGFLNFSWRVFSCCWGLPVLPGAWTLSFRNVKCS